MRPEPSALAGLRRHQLATLSAQGWREALASVGTRAVAEPLRAWAQRGLPLVVPRQPDERRHGHIVLAWAAPTAAGRQRIAVEVPLRSVAYFHEFPLAREAAGLLPRAARPAARTLLDRLQGLGLQPRAYGSYGWQALSGETYVRESSDLDLWMAVENHTQASAAVRVLAGTDTLGGVRLDGELLFPDGAGVAWREYAAWREGRARSMLVKRIASVQVTATLELPAWCESAAA
jgi:phosphoribosyl-dephospho-CoA transferase